MSVLVGSRPAPAHLLDGQILSKAPLPNHRRFRTGYRVPPRAIRPWHGRYKSSGVVMLRKVEHLIGCSLVDDAPSVQHDDARGYLPHDPEVMRALLH